MIRRRLGLHGKFVISLMVAAALPFFVGLIFFETLGYRYLIEERGRQHQVEAAGLISAINQAANAEADKLRTWLASEHELVDELVRLQHEPGPRDKNRARMLDELWASLPETDPQLRPLLVNPAVDSFKRYQQVHGAAVEILATDDAGHLVAATGKPSDYRQADEAWWQHGAALDAGDFWRDTITYDASANTFTIDMVLPYHQEGRFKGVIKMGLEVAQLVPHLVMRGIQSDATWYFVLRDGSILISSDAEIEQPGRKIPFDLLNQIRSQEHGWGVQDQEGQENQKEQIIGFSAFPSEYFEPSAYVVFSSHTSQLFEPVLGNFIGLAVAGLCLLGLCLLAGFFLIQRKVLSPLGRIESAIQSMSLLARLRARGQESQQLRQQQRVEARLRDIQEIRTGDQMEVLAREIATMISRVLNYQSEVDKSEGRGSDLQPSREASDMRQKEDGGRSLGDL